jgi:hypothetical protein
LVCPQPEEVLTYFSTEEQNKQMIGDKRTEEHNRQI